MSNYVSTLSLEVLPDFAVRKGDIGQAVSEGESLSYFAQMDKWFTGTESGEKPQKIHRLPTMWHLVALDNQLRISTGGGFDRMVMTDEDLVKIEADPGAPRPGILTRAADRGSDGFAAHWFLVNHCKVLEHFLPDQSHGVSNSCWSAIGSGSLVGSSLANEGTDLLRVLAFWATATVPSSCGHVRS